MSAVRNDHTASSGPSADLPKISKPYRPPTLAKKQVLSAVTAESPPLSRGGIPNDGSVPSGVDAPA
jgi:hypothetical protein